VFFLTKKIISLSSITNSSSRSVSFEIPGVRFTRITAWALDMLVLEQSFIFHA